MADYLKKIMVAEDSIKKLISDHTIWCINRQQCRLLGSKLRNSIDQAQKTLATSPWSEEKYAPRDLLRHFYCKVKDVVILVEKCCSDLWLRVAIVYAEDKDSFILMCLELEWFTALFQNLLLHGSESGLWLEGVSELAGQVCSKKISRTVETLTNLALQDSHELRLKLERETTGSRLSASDQTAARMLLQKIEHLENMVEGKTSKPFLWTVDGKDLVYEKSLGQGGSCRVFMTTWMDEKSAMKIFGHSNRKIFEQESVILAGLKHPNILPMIGSSIDNRGNCILLVELMDEDLQAFMTRNMSHSETGPFPLHVALDIILQIAEGMQYLHEKRIVHRDLKSSNILVKVGLHDPLTEGYVQVKVGDFGLSKTKEISSNLSQMTLNTGTSRWMAPEVHLNRNEDSESSNSSESVENQTERKFLPFKIDVYSFGLTCYEVLTGKIPFDDFLFGMIEMKRMVKHEYLRPELPDSCPIGLAALIVRCWDEEPSKRPSFIDICEEVRHIKGQVLLGEPSFALEPLSEFYKTILTGRSIPKSCPRSLRTLMEGYQKSAIRPSNTIICNQLRHVKGLLITDKDFPLELPLLFPGTVSMMYQSIISLISKQN